MKNSKALGLIASLLLFPLFLSAQCAPTISTLSGSGQMSLIYNSPGERPDNLNEIIVAISGIEGTYSVAATSETTWTTFAGGLGGVTLSGDVTIRYTDNSTETCNYVNGSLNTGLPVELAQFQGERKEEDVLLRWRTNAERNNLGFAIERSFDGTQFEKIGSRSGQGDSDEVVDYEFTDWGVRFRSPSGIIYYRLQQIDYDGSTHFSPIIAIDLDLDIKGFEITKILPGQAGDPNIRVFYHNPRSIWKIQYQLVDLNGRVLLEGAAYPTEGFQCPGIRLVCHS